MNNKYDDKLVRVMEDNSFLTSYHFTLDSGYGNMTYYHLFDGIDLVYNDFHAHNCNQLNSTGEYDDFLIINHCNRGRFETFLNDKYRYLSEGDLVFSLGSTNYTHEFPLGYYNGFQINIDLRRAQKSIDSVIGKNIINMEELIQKIDDNDSFIVIRSNSQIDHVISELYDVDDDIKEGYYKIKVIELLLFLKNSSIENVEEEYPSLKAENVRIIKDIESYLTENVEMKITLDDLSSKFNLSKTSIKNHFKEIYGKPISTWRREYRLNQAAHYLESTNMNVGEISEMVGYSNHGKFTDAFKNYYSMTPSEYRKSH